MRKYIFPLLGLLLFCSHDMFLKLDTYFLQPNAEATIKLFNGTFDKSENAIDRSRMRDASLLGNGVRTAVDSAQWSEKDGATLLHLTTGAPGTWVAGVSIYPRKIELEAEAFNDYLEHDGVLDMLEQRREGGLLEEDAVEEYSKHVKVLFQVGEQRTEDWNTPLGYPLEFIPLENPYDLHPGHELAVRLLWEGEPLANQLVYVGYQSEAHSHGEAADHEHPSEGGETHSHAGIEEHRTDKQGIIRFTLSEEGAWYLRTIRMVTTQQEGYTHVSNWATLAFGVGQGHSHDDGGHEHADSDGFPATVFWIGSLGLLVVLFFWFRRKK